MSSSTSSRMAPRSACQACHRLKMKCVREASISSFSCVRCHKAGRACSTGPGAATSRKQPGTRVVSKYPAQPLQRVSRKILKEVHHIHDRNLSPAAEETLPSIYSTSLTSHVEEEYRSQNQHGNAGSNAEQDEDSTTTINDYISNEDCIQLIDMFRERLLPCVSIMQLNAEDFDDASFLIRNNPDLAVCICYVTCAYVPGGYGDALNRLANPVKAFIHNIYSRKSRSNENDLATMQGLCILYAWAGPSHKLRDSSSNEINYWAIKSACEGFAIHANFHRASNKLRERTRLGLPVEKNNVYTKKYFFWIWLYVKSHLVSRVTRTPLTMHADASIRASSTLLSSISSDKIMEQFMGGLDLCLLWDLLGRKDTRLTEWWSSFDLEEDDDSEEPRVTLNDVDLALEYWKSRFSHAFSSDPGSNTNNLNIAYHFYYTKFCLNSHFIRRLQPSISLTDGKQAEAIVRCVDSVINIFNLYHTLGPTRRDQLRYFPGFLFIILSFCASFLIKAIQLFPALFPQPESDLGLVRKLATLMIGLGDSRHGAFVSGTLILRHLDEMELTTNQQVEISNCQQTMEGLVTPADNGIVETFTSKSSTAFEVPPDPNLLDFTDFLDPMYQNEWFNFGSPYFT